MKALVISLIMLLLSACVSAPQQHETPAWQFEGKFSLRSPSENHSGYIHWQQYPQRYAIRLWGSLGLGSQRIDGNAERIIVDNGKQQLVFNTFDNSTIAGIDLPLATLAMQAEQLLQHCPQGSQQALDNSNTWQLFCEQERDYNGQLRPYKVRISDGSTTLILLLKTWS